MTEYNTGLYIRRRDSKELWQLFLGGYTRAKPSALYGSYFKYFSEIHSDYEWVVLERRVMQNNGWRRAMYRIGDSRRVDVMPESDTILVLPHRYETRRDVECLGLWHMDKPDKMFRGSTTNRICPDCVKKEQDFLMGKERDYV